MSACLVLLFQRFLTTQLATLRTQTNAEPSPLGRGFCREPLPEKERPCAPPSARFHLWVRPALHLVLKPYRNFFFNENPGLRQRFLNLYKIALQIQDHRPPDSRSFSEIFEPSMNLQSSEMEMTSFNARHYLE